MKRSGAFRIVVPVALLSIVAVGCATAPRGVQVPAREDVKSQEKVVYRIPKTEKIVLPRERVIIPGRFYASALKGLYFPEGGKEEATRVGYGEFDSDVIAFGSDESGAIWCERRFAHRLGSGASWSSATRYNVPVSAEDLSDGYSVTITPKNIVRRADQTLTVKMGVPLFSEEMVYDLLARAHVVFKTEIDSAYGVEATLANFRRLLGGTGAKDGEGKYPFLLKGGKHSTRLRVELWPYRDGSKVVVEADTECAPTSTTPGVRTIEVREIIQEVEGEIAKVVKN